MAEKPVKKNRIVFVGLTLAVIGVIGATVLLANDRRHLNTLLLHYGLIQPPPPKPVTTAPKKPRHSENEDTVPLTGKSAEFMFSGSGTAPFARVIRFPAEEMCRLFTSRGYEGEVWQISPLGAASECTGEKIFGMQREEGRPPASIFFVLRGTDEGEITALRIKIVAPQNAAGNDARNELNVILTSLIEATGWSDLTPLLARIAGLEEFNETDYSLSVSFKREFMNTDAFNLIIRPLENNQDVHQLRRR